MTFKVNQHAGYPKSKDHVTTGSELTGPGAVPSDPGMNATAPSAVISPNQADGETKPIGIPGSSWAPNYKDKIIHTEGGHSLIFGHGPGYETVALRHKNGTQMEFGKDGEIKFLSKAGLHFGITGDGQFIFHGDILMTTTGRFGIKAGQFDLDVGHLNITVAGNKIEKIHGTKNVDIMGDEHRMVNGDRSNMIGGSERRTVGGDSKIQVSGHSSMHTAKTAQTKAGESMAITTKGNMTQKADGNFSTETKKAHSTKSEGKMTLASGDNKTLSTKGRMIKQIQKDYVTFVGGTKEQHITGNDIKAVAQNRYLSAVSTFSNTA